MDLNLQNYSRSIYTVFDLLSDVGGLTGMFVSIFAVITASWNYGYFDEFMISRLFKVKKPEEEIEPGMSYFHKSSFFITNSCHVGKFFISWLPTCCLFCKRNR